MKLKTAIEYIEFCRQRKDIDNVRRFWACEKYANFLKQLLQLWMFIPCDKEGKPLKKPERFDEWNDYPNGKNISFSLNEVDEIEEYQQACERCLFTGFELYQDTYFNNYNCVIRGSDMIIINIENKIIEDIAPLQVDLVEKVAKQFKY